MIRVAFKRLSDDIIKGWIVYQDFAAPFDRLIAVADGRVVYPKAVLHPRLHLLGHLASVLFAL